MKAIPKSTNMAIHAVFPQTATQGMEFGTIEEIKSLLRKEIQERGLLSLTSIYTTNFRSSSANWDSFSYQCKKCSANMHFARQEGRIQLTALVAEHTHSLEAQPKKAPGRKRNTEKAALQKSECSKTEQEISAQPSAKEASEQTEHFIIKIQDESKLPSFPILSKLAELQKWSKEGEVATWMEWGNEPKDGDPPLLLMLSKRMRYNFGRYGDVRGLCVFEELIDNLEIGSLTSRVLIFTVPSPSEETLLAGVGLYVEDSADTFSQLLDAFFELQGTRPRTIFSDNSKALSECIQLMIDDKRYNGSHLISPYHVLELAAANLSNKARSTHAVTLANAINTRDRDTYEECIQALRANSDSKLFVEELLASPLTRSMFYSHTGQSYFGVDRLFCYRTTKFIKHRFSEKSHPLEFIQHLMALDAQLSKYSQQVFNEYQEEVGVLMCDPRLTRVIKEYEKPVVGRFVENYLLGVMDFDVVSDIVEEKKDSEALELNPMVVQSKKHGTKYKTVDWRCTCNEFEKTGVSCPHIILLATKEPSKSYAELISWKFRKDRP